jgi:hypothetical protein
MASRTHRTAGKESAVDEQTQAEAVRTELEAEETMGEDFEAEVGDAGKEKDDGVSGQDIGL